jgi:hypothetical protein
MRFGTDDCFSFAKAVHTGISGKGEEKKRKRQEKERQGSQPWRLCCGKADDM